MTRIPIIASLALAAAAFQPVLAQDNHVKLFGAAAYVSPLSDDDVTFSSVKHSVQESDELGWDVGIEGRFTKWVGLELDYVNATHDVEIDGVTIGRTTMAPLSATFNVHVVHTKIVDLYLGPTFSYVNWGDIELNTAGGALFTTNGQGTDSETAWGASLGLDIGLGKTFAFVGGVRYLDLDLTLDGTQNTKVDPLISRLGVAFRF